MDSLSATTAAVVIECPNRRTRHSYLKLGRIQAETTPDQGLFMVVERRQ